MDARAKGITRRRFLGLTGMMGIAAAGATALAGCSSNASQEVAYSDASNGQGAQITEGEDSGSPQHGDKTLIAVFSWSGNTLRMAERINELADADFFRIETADPYPDDHDATIDQARREQDEDFIPDLGAQVENWNDYGTVFLGYPIWWYELPQAVRGFIQNLDWTGKTIVPFSSHEGSGFSGTPDDIRELCPGADILQGISIRGESVEASLDSIDDWHGGLGLA